jgi:hypothetical protein
MSSYVLMNTTIINNNNHCTINNYYASLKQDDNKESFRIICDYPKYFISNFGRIIRLRKNSWEFMNVKISSEYYSVSLNNNKKNKSFRVNRLVALSFIPNPENLPIADHIDRNKLNNHVNNLRWASHPQNQQNVDIKKTNSSGYKGVCFHKHRNQFYARIRINGIHKDLGYYDTAKEASIAYETAAKELHGEFYYKYKKDLK